MPKEENNQEQTPEIRLGMMLEVLAEDNRLIFFARVEDMEFGTLKIVNSSGGEVPPVLYNTPIKLRGYLPDMATALFEGVVRGNSQRFWLIEELKGQVRSGRSFFRQDVSVLARVSCVNGIFAPDQKKAAGGETFDCEILDISGGGVRIFTEGKYEVGDWLFIMEVNFPSVKEVFSFTCRVLRAQQQRRKYIYGCQFEGLTQKEQDRLIEAIFVLQRESTQQKTGRGR